MVSVLFLFSCHCCRSKVRSPDERTYGSLRLNVKRQSVFEDSFNKLRSKTPAEMRAKLSVSFVGEEGIDAGGVSREWYQVRQAGAWDRFGMFGKCARRIA